MEILESLQESADNYFFLAEQSRKQMQEAKREGNPALVASCASSFKEYFRNYLYHQREIESLRGERC